MTRHNVGVKDGIIAIITKNEIVGKESIDAKGLGVAPGFIDGHLHDVDPFVAKMALRDGCTIAMDLEGGAFTVGACEEFSPDSSKKPRQSQRAIESGVRSMAERRYEAFQPMIASLPRTDVAEAIAQSPIRAPSP